MSKTFCYYFVSTAIMCQRSHLRFYSLCIFFFSCDVFNTLSLFFLSALFLFWINQVTVQSTDDFLSTINRLSFLQSIEYLLGDTTYF